MTLEIAERLTKLRREKGYSQEQLADKLNVSRQAISKWERGEASPDMDNFIALAKIYDVSLDELINHNPSQKIENNNKEKSKIHIKDEEDVIDIDENGITIIDEEDEVHIGKDGIHVTEKEIINNKKDVTKIIVGLIPLVITVVYFIFSASFNLWHPLWIIFLGIPVFESLVFAIKDKSVNRFSYPIFITALYLLFGFLFNYWHPGWWMFITIPLYYALANIFDNLIKKK